MSTNEEIRNTVIGAAPFDSSSAGELLVADLDLRLAGSPQNDLGNAERFIARHGRDFIYVGDSPNKGNWYAWDGTRWSQEQGDREARLQAHQTAEAILSEVAALEAAGPRDGQSREAWQKEIVSLRRWASVSGNAVRLDAMLATAAPRLMRWLSDLNANPQLLNALNGTIELRPEPEGGVALRAHRRDDLITRVVPVRYDPNADGPDFRTWLAEILPDEPVRVFLQRYFGYALQGTIAEQCMVMFWGRGQNGKSTLLNVIRGILGPYCVTLPVAALLEQQFRRGSDATPELARLPGARLALASEPEKKERLSASAIKSLTGGEPIAARALFREFVEFVPVAKLVLTVNEKPIVPAQDHGMWRRLLLVEFGVQIPDSKLIGRFEQKLLEEAPGILNWLLDGFRLWEEQGLAVPEVVRAATEEYRTDQDHIGRFLGSATKRSGDPESHVTSAQLWQAYAKWCRENAVEQMNRNSFGRAVTGQGLKRGKSNNIVYRGIELTEAYRDQGEIDVDNS